jgi:hypothetical protein
VVGRRTDHPPHSRHQPEVAAIGLPVFSYGSFPAGPGRLDERDQARRIGEGQTLRQQTAFDDYLAQRAADPSRTFRQHLRRTGGAIEE